MKYFLRIFLIALLVAGSIFACKKGGENSAHVEETLTAGTATFVVDNTIQPIVEDVLAVFESIYIRAQIKQVNLNENALLQALQQDTAKVAVMARKLTPEEEKHFTDKGITPKVIPFATDAIALIINKSSLDTVVNLNEVFKILQGSESQKVKRLVFDNANSSVTKFMLNEAGVSGLPQKNVYSQGTAQDVIKYVHDNPGAIGLVGVNWIVQPPSELLTYVENIKVLGVNNVKKGKANAYFKPSQTNIATGNYPLTRTLYVLNYQGKNGLGMGFANYISAPDGQRIILKSGLLPETIPERSIQVRNKL
ncbi:PstS family phosphate ABC transporter substrate-binding protein [Flavobacterium rhizosphaerae]|uniref:Substrate-binding domain-containing protein n=1 Tax=Flavobacterium rhizosphaerae TaxID=3163298 RepID=A0ABW8Z078_9FLAO